MYAAKRSLTPDDLAQAFERYKKLTQETARSIVQFHERRTAAANAQETAQGAAQARLWPRRLPRRPPVSAAPGPAGVAA